MVVSGGGVGVGGFRFGVFPMGYCILSSRAGRTIVVSTNYFCRRRGRTLGECVSDGDLAIGRLLGARLRLSRVFNGPFLLRRCKLGTRTGRTSRF